MEFSFKTKERLRILEASFVSSEYKVTGYDFKNSMAFINKVDTYKKPNGKKLYVHHKFGEWVNIPNNYIITYEKEIEYETNDWFVSHRETATKVIKYSYVPEEYHSDLIKAYFNQRFKKQ